MIAADELVRIDEHPDWRAKKREVSDFVVHANVCDYRTAASRCQQRARQYTAWDFGAQ